MVRPHANLDIFSISINIASAQLAKAVEYADCNSPEGLDPPTHKDAAY